LGDVVVHPAEIVAFQFIATLTAQFFEDVSQALNLFALPIAKSDCIMRRSAAFRSPW